MKNIFKSEDFLDNSGHTLYSAGSMADIANAKLNAMIEQAPIIATQNGNPYIWKMCAGSMDGVMEVARLMFVEDYIQKPCKHQPPITRNAEGWMIQNYCCQFCGVKLDYKAEWKAKSV